MNKLCTPDIEEKWQINETIFPVKKLEVWTEKERESGKAEETESARHPSVVLPVDTMQAQNYGWMQYIRLHIWPMAIDHVQFVHLNTAPLYIRIPVKWKYIRSKGRINMDQFVEMFLWSSEPILNPALLVEK